MKRATQPNGKTGTWGKVSNERWISHASSGLIEEVSGGNFPCANPGFLGESSIKNLSQKDCCPSHEEKGAVSNSSAIRKTLPRPKGTCTKIGLATGSEGSGDSRIIVWAEEDGDNFAICLILIGSSWLTSGLTQRFSPLSVRNPFGLESKPSSLQPVIPRARSKFLVDSQCSPESSKRVPPESIQEASDFSFSWFSSACKLLESFVPVERIIKSIEENPIGSPGKSSMLFNSENFLGNLSGNVGLEGSSLLWFADAFCNASGGKPAVAIK